jgi:hypothetical protein
MSGVFGVGPAFPPRPLRLGIGKKQIGLRRLTLWLACVMSQNYECGISVCSLDRALPGSGFIVFIDSQIRSHTHPRHPRFHRGVAKFDASRLVLAGLGR